MLMADAMALLMPTPQVIAILAAAIDRRDQRGFQQLGGGGTGKLAACHEIDHLGKADAADQLLDRVAAIADHPRLHVDDRSRPPILRGRRVVGRGHVAAAHMARSRASSSISRLENPSSVRRSPVSAPSAGGGDAGSGSPLV